jgi:putative ABC transport system permease protein
MMRALRWLLHLFPAAFRERYEDEVLEILQARSRDVRRRQGWIGFGRMWLYQSFDLFRAAWSERTHARPRVSGPRSPRIAPKRRHLRGESLLATVRQDIKFGIRTLARNPLFTLVAILTLGLGVGATTSIFSVVDGVLLRPLPFDDPDELTVLQVNTGGPGWYGASEPEFIDFREQLRSLETVSAYEVSEVTLGDSTEPRRVKGVRLTADLLPMLGVAPSIGRLFTPEEDVPGANPVVVLSYGLWQQHFGADPAAVGRAIEVQGRLATVIGVMPQGFSFPDADHLWWAPRQLDFENPWTRNNHYLEVLARRAPGINIEQAQDEANRLARRSIEAFPDYYGEPGYNIRLQQLRENEVGGSRTALLVVMGAAAFVLITACVNIANLLLVRGESRRYEVAIRTALGAARRRVTRQFLTEHSLLAIAGGLAGVALAWSGVPLLLSVAPDSIPRLEEITIDGRVLGFSLVLIAFAGVLFGLMPAFQAGRTDMNEALVQRGHAQSRALSSPTLRRLLVVSQLALSVLLAGGAGIMVRTVANLHQVDTGFRHSNVVTMRVDPSTTAFNTPESRLAFWQDFLSRVSGLPGVISAGAVPWLPLGGGFPVWSYLVEGQRAASISDAPSAPIQQATPGYLDALGLTLVRGRFFNADDRVDARPVAVINEAMAIRHWPGEDPIGKRIRLYPAGRPWMEIVGVVRNVRDDALDREARPKYYWPYAQSPAINGWAIPSMTLVVRSDGDPILLLGPIREQLRALDSTAPISRVVTMEQLVARSLGDKNFTMILLVVFGLVALLLASVGVYGVVSFVVSQRTHEIGLRMALGASGRQVVRRVLREGIALAAGGLVLGSAGVFLASRVLQSLVFGVSTTDPVTYGGVATVLVTASVAASYIPAWRASRVDPMVALRSE